MDELRRIFEDVENTGVFDVPFFLSELQVDEFNSNETLIAATLKQSSVDERELKLALEKARRCDFLFQDVVKQARSISNREANRFNCSTPLPDIDSAADVTAIRILFLNPIFNSTTTNGTEEEKEEDESLASTLKPILTIEEAQRLPKLHRNLIDNLLDVPLGNLTAGSDDYFRRLFRKTLLASLFPAHTDVIQRALSLHKHPMKFTPHTTPPTWRLERKENFFESRCGYWTDKGLQHPLFKKAIRQGLFVSHDFVYRYRNTPEKVKRCKEFSEMTLKRRTQANAILCDMETLLGQVNGHNQNSTAEWVAAGETRREELCARLESHRVSLKRLIEASKSDKKRQGVYDASSSDNPGQ